MSSTLRCARCFLTGVALTVAVYVGALVYLVFQQATTPIPTVDETAAATSVGGACVSVNPISLEETTSVVGPDGTSWRVHTCIATRFDELLRAAADAGHFLGGGSWRDGERQIALRRQNCGVTEHAVHHMPSSQCSPPTARPGRSRHEAGLAFDFTVDGQLIRSRTNPAFVWLEANAGAYGLKNLPSEPWHYSSDGA